MATRSTTAHTVRLILGVVAADQAGANTICEGRGMGPNTFSVPVIRTTDPDNQPARGYYCEIQMKPAEALDFRNALVAAGIEGRGFRQARNSWDPSIATPTPEEVLAAQGFRRKPAPLPPGSA